MWCRHLRQKLNRAPTRSDSSSRGRRTPRPPAQKVPSRIACSASSPSGGPRTTCTGGPHAEGGRRGSHCRQRASQPSSFDYVTEPFVVVVHDDHEDGLDEN